MASTPAAGVVPAITKTTLFKIAHGAHQLWRVRPVAPGAPERSPARAHIPLISHFLCAQASGRKGAMEKATTRRKIANNASARRLARRNHWRYGGRTHYN